MRLSKLHWRLHKYLVDESISFIKRILTYNESWSNKDIEVFQLESGSTTNNNVYEQYFQGREKYPIITVAPGNGQFTNAAFNDLIRVVDDDHVSLGSRGLYTEEIYGGKVLVFDITGILNSEGLRGLSFDVMCDSYGNTGYTVEATLYSDYFGSSKTQLASGSSKEINSFGIFENIFVEMYPQVVIDKVDSCFIELKTSGEGYYVSIDNGESNNYNTVENSVVVNKSGSIVGNLLLPAFIRIGGDYQGSINVRVLSKGDTDILYDLSSIISQYFILARQSQISRLPAAVNSTILTGISEFLKKGIFIKSVIVSNVDTKKRSGDELETIFVITLNINVMTEWFQDYPADTLKEIVVDVKTFIQNHFNIVV